MDVVLTSEWLADREVEPDELPEVSASLDSAPAVREGADADVPEFDESEPEAPADCALGPAPDAEADDSLDDGFEGPASESSAWAMPAVAIAVPIPRATASAPIRPISNELEVAAGSTSPGAPVREAMGDDF